MKKSYKNLLYLLLVVIGAGIYYFNKDRFSKDIHYYGYFETVAGLEAGSPVVMKGVQIGKVHNLEIAENGKVRVTLLMHKDQPLPQGSEIKLVAGEGILSSKSIQIVKGTGNVMLAEGAVLPTHTDTTTMESVSAKITPLLASGKLILAAADSGLTYINYFIRTGLTTRAVKTMIELDSQSRNLSEQAKDFNEKSLAITKGIRSLRSGTEGLAGKDASIDSTIHNAEKSTTELSKKEMRKMVEEMRTNIAKINNSLKSKQSDKPDDMYPKLKGSLDTLKGKLKAMSEDGKKAAQEEK